MVGLVTAAIGVLIFLVAVGRVTNIPLLKTRRWPGDFGSGTREQRRNMVALIPLGFGFALSGLSQSIGPSRSVLTGVLVFIAIGSFAVALLTYAGVLKIEA